MRDSLEEVRAAVGDRYEVERELGRGGFATVYLALDRRHQRPVAIKVLAHDLAQAVSAERFLREITFAATLTHPNILPLFDSGSAQGLLYYVMPYAEGESLRARLRRDGALAIDDALRITCEVLDGLEYAHGRNVLHRDIKPENILLLSDHAVIADFGIARAIRATKGEGLTLPGSSIGTPAYMSPEQALGDGRVDARSDLYAVGCMLYEMLGGEPPATGPSPQAILARQLAGEVRPLRPVRGSVSPELEATVRRALAANPADRFPTAAAFRADLEAHRTGARTPVAMRQRWAGGAVSGRVLRRAGTAVLAAVLLVSAIYVAAQYFIGARRDAAARGIAVLPFRVHSGGDDLAEGLADLLATTLEGTPGLRVVDPWALWRPLRSEREGRARAPDPQEADGISRRLGARYFVLGSLSEAARIMTLTLRIYRVGNGEPEDALSVEASSDSLGTLVQRAAVQVISRVAGSSSADGGAGVGPLITESPEALKAYLEARVEIRRGRLGEADAAITRALKLDTAFALAALEAVTIRSWIQFTRAQPYGGLADLTALALRHQDGLSERQRMRVQMYDASVAGRGARTAELAERLLQLDSADVDTWLMLTYTHLVSGWQYGAGPDEARVAADRALALDSTHVLGLAHSAYLAAWGGDSTDIRRYIRLLREADTAQSIIRGSELALASMLGSDETYETLLDTIVEQPIDRWIAVLRMLRAYQPERAERLLARTLARPGAGLARRTAVGARVQLMLAEGRVREVGRELREGAYSELPSFERVVAGGILSTSLAGVSDSAETLAALEAVESYVNPDSAVAHFYTRPVLWFGWAQAAYHATEGDSSRARRWQAVFQAFPYDSLFPTYRESLREDIEARLAVRVGDVERARRHAGEAFRLWGSHGATDLEFMPSPAMRLHLANLLRASGRADSAEAIFRSLVPPTTWMGSLATRSALELGHIIEERGDPVEAATYYWLALVLWERGGPEVEPYRSEAAAGLRRTGADRETMRFPARPPG